MSPPVDIIAYPFDVEIGDGVFAGPAGDLGQRFPRIHESILGKAGSAEGSVQQVEGFFEVDVTI